MRYTAGRHRDRLQTDRSGGGWIIYAANHSSYKLWSQKEWEAGWRSESDRWWEREAKQVGREGGGGVVESKKRIEQWRESMFPMRSIELSIILLQAVDGSSWDEEEREEGRKRSWRQTAVWGGTGRSCFTGNYLQCRVWWWTLCCNANLLSCLSCGADCRGQIHKRQERGVGGGGSNRMEMRGKDRKKRREENKGIEGKRQRTRETGTAEGEKDVMTLWTDDRRNGG